MITSKQRTLIGLAALFAIGSTQACGSDGTDSSPVAGAPGTAGAPVTGTAGAAVGGGGGAPAAGAPAGGAPAAGAPAGGAPAGGAPAGGAGGAAAGAPAGGGGSGGAAAAGAGGSAAGSAGASGGSAGSSAGAGGGGSTPTYAAVKAIFTASCGAGAGCHNGNPHTNFTTGDLYTTLSTPIPATPAQRECKGSTLITPNDGPNSLIVKIVSGSTMCQNSGANQTLPRMPNNCGSNPMCLSAAQIKTISDWITGGAPH